MLERAVVWAALATLSSSLVLWPTAGTALLLLPLLLGEAVRLVDGDGLCTG